MYNTILTMSDLRVGNIINFSMYYFLIHNIKDEQVYFNMRLEYLCSTCIKVYIKRPIMTISFSKKDTFRLIANKIEEIGWINV